MTPEENIGEEVIAWWYIFAGLFRKKNPEFVADCIRAMQQDWLAFSTVEFFHKDGIYNVLDRKDATKRLNAVQASRYIPQDIKESISKALRNPGPRKDEQKANASRSGYLYLMRHGRTGLIKIGFSKKPKAREKTLQAEDPHLELIYMTEATMEDERQYHDIFSYKRKRGEWFELTEQDIQRIKDETTI